MTVDQITAEVESRRESRALVLSDDSEEWTAVGSEEADDLAESSENTLDGNEDVEDELALEEEEVVVSGKPAVQGAFCHVRRESSS
jgi:hypothetical protein